MPQPGGAHRAIRSSRSDLIVDSYAANFDSARASRRSRTWSKTWRLSSQGEIALLNLEATSDLRRQPIPIGAQGIIPAQSRNSTGIPSAKIT